MSVLFGMEPPLPPVPVRDQPLRVATERQMLDALHAHYRGGTPSGPRYVCAEGVPATGGFFDKGDPQSRTADFIAVDTWPSGGFARHGHEVKVSRSDWLRELKEPEKAGAFLPFMHRWWLVVPDKRIVRDGELPDGWGLMALRDDVLRVVVKAPWRKPEALSSSRLAALLRASLRTAEYQRRSRS